MDYKELAEIYKNERDTYKRLAKSLIKQNNKLEDEIRELQNGLQEENEVAISWKSMYKNTHAKYFRYKSDINEHIKNLQQEIGILRQNAQNLVKKNDELEERIDKAIEYIKDNTYEAYGTDYMDLTGIKELLKILDGGEE